MRRILSVLALLGVVAALGLSSTSCDGSGHGGSGVADTIALRGDTIVPYDLLQKPMRFTASNDLLFVLNSGTDTLIDEFTVDGAPVRSIIRCGQGPNELGKYVNKFEYSEVTGEPMLLVDNSDPRKIFAIKGFATDTPEVVTFAELTDTSATPIGRWSSELSNGQIVVTNGTLDAMVAIYYRQGNLVKKLQPYPSASELNLEGAPEWFIPNVFGPFGSTSPDGRHFIAMGGESDATFYGNVRGDSLDMVVNLNKMDHGKKIEGVNEGYVSFGFVENPMQYYVGSPALSNSAVYAMYEGRPQSDFRRDWKAMMEEGTPMPVNVEVRDFDGNLKHVLRLQEGPGMIAVTPDNRYLFLIADSGEGTSIIRYDLSGIVM